VTTLLHIPVSPRGDASFSRAAGYSLLARLREAVPTLEVVTRDLDAPPLPHPDRAFVEASLMPADDRGPAQDEALARSEILIGEVEAADVILISTPMNNFTVPSVLKAWIDYVVRPGRTFDITPNGKVGLLANRPVLAVVACGGRFGEQPGAQSDFFTPYVRYALGSVGITDIEVLRLEGLTRDPSHIAETLQRAASWVSRVAAPTG